MSIQTHMIFFLFVFLCEIFKDRGFQLLKRMQKHKTIIKVIHTTHKLYTKSYEAI